MDLITPALDDIIISFYIVIVGQWLMDDTIISWL